MKNYRRLEFLLVDSEKVNRYNYLDFRADNELIESLDNNKIGYHIYKRKRQWVIGIFVHDLISEKFDIIDYVTNLLPDDLFIFDLIDYAPIVDKVRKSKNNWDFFRDELSIGGLNLFQEDMKLKLPFTKFNNLRTTDITPSQFDLFLDSLGGEKNCYACNDLMVGMFYDNPQLEDYLVENLLKWFNPKKYKELTKKVI